jgi:hypothetical protein
VSLVEPPVSSVTTSGVNPIFVFVSPSCMMFVATVKVLTEGSVPMVVMKPESLLKADNGISEISFLLSAPLSRIINSSSEELTACVISVSSDKSTLSVTPPLLPPPDSPVPAVTPVMSPALLV